ncbi:sulfotransferase [Sulfitobacter sp. MF3-043]|uniref:sulfotransferase n=1 Tax=Sulfitobacter sediminivivens TaxID=3252902 RepID=UPI0036DE8029
MDHEPLVSYSSARARYLNLLVSGVLAPLEFILERWARPDDSAICFIIGPPRSGTTLLYELVTTRFQCGYFTNLAKRLFRVPVAATWLCRTAMRRRRGSFDSVYGELGGNAAPNEAGRIWSHWMPYAAPYNLDQPGLTPARIRRKMAAICGIAGQPMVVKNMILQTDFLFLIETFPNAVFLYVERNWADNARSLVKAREDKVSMDGTGWWSLRPPGWKVYAGADPVTQSCAQVMLSHMDIVAHLDKAGRDDRVMKVDYEQLCAQPDTVLEEIETFWTRNAIAVTRKPGVGAVPKIVCRRQPEDDTRARIRACLDEMSDGTTTHGEKLQ